MLDEIQDSRLKKDFRIYNRGFLGDLLSRALWCGSRNQHCIERKIDTGTQAHTANSNSNFDKIKMQKNFLCAKIDLSAQIIFNS